MAKINDENFNPLLSVLVITYNQEKYISQTLDSILSQKHNYDYEVVVGDDCSSDDTKNIISRYVSNYPEIIIPLFNKKNLGVVGNYFNVIAQCRGKYIMQCAGDDWWLPEKVEKQIQFMEENPDCCMCYGKAKKFNETRNQYEDDCIGFADTTFERLLQLNCIPALTVCIRREKVIEYLDSIAPLTKKWLMEDYPLWLWCSAKYSIKYLPEEFGVYRVLSFSASHSSDIDKQIAFFKSTCEIKNYFLSNYSNSNMTLFNFHREKARILFYMENSKRNEYIEELKLIPDKTFQERVLIACSKSKLLYKLLRMRSKLKMRKNSNLI